MGKNVTSKDPSSHLARRGSWIYLVASIPLLAFALAGWEYGAFWGYFVLAIVCISQFFRPMKPVWLFLFVVYSAGSVIYLGLLLSDVGRILAGARPTVLVDADDSFVFGLLVVFLIGVSYGLFRIRPIFRRELEEENPFASDRFSSDDDVAS